jgi:hypothetical protein
LAFENVFLESIVFLASGGDFCVDDVMTSNTADRSLVRYSRAAERVLIEQSIAIIGKYSFENSTTLEFVTFESGWQLR